MLCNIQLHSLNPLRRFNQYMKVFSFRFNFAFSIIDRWEKRCQYQCHKVMIDLRGQNKLNWIVNTCVTCFNKTCFLPPGFHCCFAKKNEDYFLHLQFRLTDICKKKTVSSTLYQVALSIHLHKLLLPHSVYENDFLTFTKIIIGCVGRLSCHGILFPERLQMLFSKNNSTDLLLTWGNRFN